MFSRHSIDNLQCVDAATGLLNSLTGGRVLTRMDVEFKGEVRTVFAHVTGAAASSSSSPRSASLPRRGVRRGGRRLELVVVLAVMGLLGAVALASVGGVSRVSLLSTCEVNARAVGNAVDALRVENPTVVPGTSVEWRRALLSSSTYVGGPFLRAWPHDASYVITVAGIGEPPDTGDGVVPSNGDVIVTRPTSLLRYDATARPQVTCQVP